MQVYSCSVVDVVLYATKKAQGVHKLRASAGDRPLACDVCMSAKYQVPVYVACCLSVVDNGCQEAVDLS